MILLYLFIAAGFLYFSAVVVYFMLQTRSKFLKQATYAQIARRACRLLEKSDQAAPVLKRYLKYVEKHQVKGNLHQAVWCRTVLLCCLHTLKEGSSDYTNDAMEEAMLLLGAGQ